MVVTRPFIGSLPGTNDAVDDSDKALKVIVEPLGIEKQEAAHETNR